MKFLINKIDVKKLSIRETLKRARNILNKVLQKEKKIANRKIQGSVMWL